LGDILALAIGKVSQLKFSGSLAALQAGFCSFSRLPKALVIKKSLHVPMPLLL
jgi:hypothetical protein